MACVLCGAILSAARAAHSTGSPLLLSSRSVANVPFGTEKGRAVEKLTARLGRPTKRFVSDGCGPNYIEVAWGHLYVEFRRGRLSGFRYMRGTWLKPQPIGSTRGTVRPRLTTVTGVGVGSTLRQVRDHDGALKLVGTDRWRGRDGLIFYISFATDQPPPATSPITEIKYGTCGDW